MKIKFSILVLLLLQICNAETVSLDKACGCTAIQIQSDCVQMTKCEWDSTNNKCIAGLKESYYSQLCVSITDQTKCIKQYGCAFVDKKCVAFGNCVSYIGTSNAECQKFSQRCNYNPTKKICTDENVCGEYSAEDKQTECQSVLQINGDQLCLYDTTNKICKKKVCSDYLKTTDDDCKNVLQDITCKTDKVKCVSSYQSCSSYKVEECLNVTANDGPCELLAGEAPKCQSRSCPGATDEYKTAEKCNEYKTGCQFNGVSCVSQLSECKSIVNDVDNVCPKSIGIYGQCQILTGADGKTSCRDPLCTDYVKTTDKDCQEANTKLKCITNEYQCVDKLETDCTTVDINSCGAGRSAKGYCKLSGEKCVDNPCLGNTGSTNKECSKYSATCVSDGINCVEQLLDKCSLITDQDKCPSMRTKEGKCTTFESQCKISECQNQTTLTTDEECNAFSSITPSIPCVYNGIQCANQFTTPCSSVDLAIYSNCSYVIGSDGICMADPNDATKCKPMKCEELTDKTLAGCIKGKCSFDGISCVSALQTCDKYTADCEKVISTSGACVLDATTNKCVNKTCKTAPASNTTNDQCNEYSLRCVTTGQGCIDVLRSCSEYTGTQTVCEKYIGNDGKCTGDTKNTETSKCSAKVCMNSTTKNEDGCKAYTSKCLYSPLQKSCLPSISDCSLIPKQSDCEYNLTQADARLCLWQNDKCVTASCNIVNKGGSAEVCAIFGTDCSYDNISGCINKKSYPCSTLRSRQSCTTDSDGKSCLWDVKNSKCFQFDQCEDFPLTVYKNDSGEVIQKTPQQIADETAICQQLSDRCYSDGSVTIYNTANCVGKQPCSLLSDSICVKSIGIDGQCGYNGVTKLCEKFDKCSNVVLTTHAECQQYSSTCTSDGTNCVDIKTCADFKLKEGCEIGGTDGQCEWKDDACKLWTCGDSAITTHAGCQAKSTNCTTDGKNCIPIASCSSYTETSCYVGITNKKQVQCIFDKETKTCRDKICTDYTNVTSKSDCVSQGCAFDSDKKQCISIATCKTYTSQSLCDNQGLNQTCIWTSLNNDAVANSTCMEITTCAILDSNEKLCNARNGCTYISANATANITAACKDTTCSNFNQGSTSITGCKPFLSADQKSVTICGWNEKNQTCVPADGSAYDQNNCFKLSQYTYYWSKTSNKCVSCSAVTNSSTNSSSSTNGSTDTTTTTDNNAFLLKQFILSSIIFQLV